MDIDFMCININASMKPVFDGHFVAERNVCMINAIGEKLDVMLCVCVCTTSMKSTCVI